MMEEVRSRLSSECVFRTEEPIRRKTTLKVGGTVRYYAEPATLEDLQTILREAFRMRLEVFFLGRGSNVIALDGGFEGLVIHLRHANWKRLERIDAMRLRAGAGVRLRELCGSAGRMGLGGFEFLEGIPGTVGGALRMNAGAMGGWMYELVEEVRLIGRDGEERRYSRDEMHFGYRHCRELMDGCAVETVLRAPERSDEAAVREKIARFQRHRYASQPKQASAGCVFKNPPGDSAGRLIDVHGLKGLACGDAEVSLIHGNFIINKGRATSGDVVELVRRVRAELHRKSGILLEPEVLLLGGTWEELL